MPLGMEVGLGPVDFVFDGDPATPRKKGTMHPHTIFGPCLLCPNGWMDEAATWYGSRPRPRPHCISSPRKGHNRPLPIFGPCLFWPRSPISATAELLFYLSPLTVRINCSFLKHIFAVLLRDLSRLSCHFVQRFLEMNTRRQAHKPVKKCNYWGRFSKRNGQEGRTASACQTSWR